MTASETLVKEIESISEKAKKVVRENFNSDPRLMGIVGNLNDLFSALAPSLVARPTEALGDESQSDKKDDDWTPIKVGDLFEVVTPDAAAALFAEGETPQNISRYVREECIEEPPGSGKYVSDITISCGDGEVEVKVTAARDPEKEYGAWRIKIMTESEPDLVTALAPSLGACSADHTEPVEDREEAGTKVEDSIWEVTSSAAALLFINDETQDRIYRYV